MSERMNPLDHPIIFTTPEYTTEESAWLEHTPFAMFLIEALKPRTFVELGTHIGCSYCAFCQAVKALGTDTRCYAVDTWQGDAHAGYYSSKVLDNLKAIHDPKYSDFSTLMQMTFDEASAKFEPGSVDLLHIDGFHTYEAARNDFDTWISKMSPRGVVIIHDSNMRDRGFGVYKVIDELRSRYPVFEFLHGYGLAVVAVGEETPPALESFLHGTPGDIESLRNLFAKLGQALHEPLMKPYFEVCITGSGQKFLRLRKWGMRVFRGA